MTKQILLIGLLTGLLVNLGCNNATSDTTLQVQSNPQDMTVTKETLKQILDAFNRHDLDAIMEFFSDDCTFDFPRAWTLTGTSTSGLSLKVRGCDLWEFRNGRVTRKDSYWKIVEPTTK